MAIQNLNLGVAPTGAGGDTFRSAAAKINDNFTNNAHAASRLVGTAAGNVMAVGAFGLGGIQDVVTDPFRTFSTEKIRKAQFLNTTGVAAIGVEATCLVLTHRNTYAVNGLFLTSAGRFFIATTVNSQLTDARTVTYKEVLSKQNTTVDANGFIKAASPIVQLYADKIELNDEATEQDISFEKVGVGHYLIKGSSGFANQGWYIETPKDANGNVLFSVIYETLENGDISVKTYKKKFDLETASIVVDLDSPVDITEGRWIDVRLHELPMPEIEITESRTPSDFQPTGLAQAVATVMESYHDPEQ